MIIWYPETKGKTLEEMDGLFGKLLSSDAESHGHGTFGPATTKNRSVEGDAAVERQTVEGASKR